MCMSFSLLAHQCPPWKRVRACVCRPQLEICLTVRLIRSHSSFRDRLCIRVSATIMSVDWEKWLHFCRNLLATPAFIGWRKRQIFRARPTALKTQFISHKRDATLFWSMTNLIWWLKPFSSERLYKYQHQPAFSLSLSEKTAPPAFFSIPAFLHFAPAVLHFTKYPRTRVPRNGSGKKK